MVFGIFCKYICKNFERDYRIIKLFLFIKGFNEIIIDICNELWYLVIELVYICICYIYM